MSQTRDIKAEKRRRGRPAGSATTLQADEALMRRAAVEMVREKHLKFSTALRGLGINESKDLARLRKRWNKVGEIYLENARTEMRENQTIGQNLAELLPIVEIVKMVQGIDETLKSNRLVARLGEIALHLALDSVG